MTPGGTVPEMDNHRAMPYPQPHTSEPEVDVVVIGSGFGGSVAALRLAEKGYRVLVYEAGRRFADHELPKTSWRLRRFLWAPLIGCYGIQRIHRLPDLLVLAGAGVGGGSLNYANTLYVPPATFFTDPQWTHITDWAAELAPHYSTAQRMLGVVTNPCTGPVEEAMHDVARELGVESSFRQTPVAVFFGRDGALEPGMTVPDPYFGGDGPDRTGCTQCGACMTGCRVGAKNTLVKNYLALAERLGVRIEPLRTVVDVRPVDPDRPAIGYRVTTARTGPWSRARRTIVAQHVVVAAGTWGTQSLLHRLRAEGSLPHLPASLGELTRTNSEAILGAATRRVPRDADLTRGVAITTSFHPQPDTHVENCRYGPGSGAMGLLAAILVDGPGGRAGTGGRLRRLVRTLAVDPGAALRAMSVRRWAERSVIGLVMQTRDNSITVGAVPRRLGPLRLPGLKLSTRPGHGAPNPRWLPVGHDVVRRLARRLGERTGVPADPLGSVLGLVDVPVTAHFLGGCPIGSDPTRGVVDPYHRVFGYPGLHVVDGSTVSANPGVNPALTITAQAERALALWPAKGETDLRPALGDPYVRLDPVEDTHARASSAR